MHGSWDTIYTNKTRLALCIREIAGILYINLFPCCYLLQLQYLNLKLVKRANSRGLQGPSRAALANSDCILFLPSCSARNEQKCQPQNCFILRSTDIQLKIEIM